MAEPASIKVPPPPQFNYTRVVDRNRNNDMIKKFKNKLKPRFDSQHKCSQHLFSVQNKTPDGVIFCARSGNRTHIPFETRF